MFPSAEQFGRDVGALGISNGDTVVLYDSGGWVAAPRAWWMFLSFGQRDIRVLDGGLKKWARRGAAGRERRGDGKAVDVQGDIRCAAGAQHQQMLANVESRAEQVIDARASERFEGKRAEPWPGLRAGPYPGQPQLALRRTVRRGDRR